MKTIKSILLVSYLFLSLAAHAQLAEDLTEFDPYAPDAEEMLKKFDQVYEQEMGMPAHINKEPRIFGVSDCFRDSCAVWALVDKASQTLSLYLGGELKHTWLVSTGVPGRGTPNFDRHPDGRIYDRYTSSRFPGGDYAGLGNMPYAVFISGGFALHGTPKGNWPLLGRKASHGCVRQHPDNALYFNRLVRAYGVQNVWITVR